jgi:energy-coupling factor transporter ATP-binding protein EcfA2
MNSEKLSAIRSANAASCSPENSSSVLISEISGKKSSSELDSGPSTLDSSSGLRAGEFFAVKDVSFELRRGECLGLIGHNGAGKTTLLKMLNGLIKPDAGNDYDAGACRGADCARAGFNPILTGREPKGWPPARRVLRLGEEARRTSNQRLALRAQRRREGASQNIYINGSVLGFTKKEPERKGGEKNRRPEKAEGRATEGWTEGQGIGDDASQRVPQAGLEGFATREKREPNRQEDRRDHRLCRDSGIHRHAGNELFLGYDRALGLRKADLLKS